MEVINCSNINTDIIFGDDFLGRYFLRNCAKADFYHAFKDGDEKNKPGSADSGAAAEKEDYSSVIFLNNFD